MSTQFNPPEEELLIKRAAEGDREAFGELVRLYERLVYNTVKARVGNETDALDISQDTFIKIWRSVGKYRGDCRFATWVYRICVNTCIDFLRHSKFTVTEAYPTYTDKDGDENYAELADESTTSDPQRAAERNETSVMVRRAISMLPNEQREVIILRDLEGYSYDDISDMLGLEIGTVKSRINRARLKLRELLADYGKNN